MTQPYNKVFSKHILTMEKDAIKFLKIMIKEAQEDGYIKKNISVNSAAYMIDSILANLMKSPVSEIETMKFKAHFNCSPSDSDKVVKTVIDDLKNMMA